MAENDHLGFPPTRRQLFWLRRPPPGKFPGKSRHPGNFPGNSGNCPVDIARGISRDLGCAARKSPGEYHGRAAKTPANSPGNRPANFTGSPMEMHFAGNAPPMKFPGKYHTGLIGCLRRGRHISNRVGIPAGRISGPSPEQRDTANRTGGRGVADARNL